MGLILRPHQRDILPILGENNSYALLWDMRTGKTLPALIDATDKLISGEAENWLWLGPLSALGAVSNNAKLLSPERKELIRTKMTCINYDKLSRPNNSWQKKIGSVHWDGITLDEGHRIKNPQANTTKFIIGTTRGMGFACGAKYKRFLSGTPVANSHWEDFWSMLRFFYGEDYMTRPEFMARYCIEVPIPGTYAKKVVGYRFITEVMEQVAQCSSVVRLEDISDAPEDNEDYVIHVPWSNSKNTEPFNKTTRKVYDELLENCVEELDMVVDNPMARMTRLRQVASGVISDDFGEKYVLNQQKTTIAVENIEEFDGKVVVFHFFTHTGESLRNALDKKKISYMSLNGQTPAKEKETIWQDFQADPNCKVFVAQISSGNSGIDLYSADMIIFMEPCLSSTDLEQARKRIADVNATVAKSFVFLLTENSIEEEIYERLKAHENFTEKMFVSLIVDQAKKEGKISKVKADSLKEVYGG